MYFNWRHGPSRTRFPSVVAVSCLIWNVIVSTDQRQRDGRLMILMSRMSLGTTSTNQHASAIVMPDNLPSHHHFSTLTMLDVGFDTSFQTNLANAITDGLIVQDNIGVSTPCPRCRRKPRPP